MGNSRGLPPADQQPLGQRPAAGTAPRTSPAPNSAERTADPPRSSAPAATQVQPGDQEPDGRAAPAPRKRAAAAAPQQPGSAAVPAGHRRCRLADRDAGAAAASPSSAASAGRWGAGRVLDRDGGQAGSLPHLRAELGQQQRVAPRSSKKWRVDRDLRPGRAPRRAPRPGRVSVGLARRDVARLAVRPRRRAARRRAGSCGRPCRWSSSGSPAAPRGRPGPCRRGSWSRSARRRLAVSSGRRPVRGL